MKRLIFLSALVLLPMLYLNSQSLKVFEEWASSGGTQNMFLENVTVTNSAGGSLIGGATLNSNGNYDIFLSRYSRKGVLLWTAQYNGAGNGDDAVSAICVGDSSNFYITGTVYSNSTNQNDCVVLKYDKFGNLKWARTYNGNANGPDFGTDICIDSNNNVYIGGATTRTGSCFDFLVLKYDRGGNPQWANYYDNLNLYDISNSIICDGVNVYVAGGTQTSATKYEYAVADFDISTGAFNQVRISSSTGTGLDRIRDLCLDATGNIYVTGGAVNANTGYDYKTIKLDDNLNVEWTAIYNGADSLDDMGRSIQVDASGYVYVTGYSTTLDEDTNMVTLKYDSAGTIIWTEEYNNSNDSTDKGEALYVDNLGNIYVAGFTHNGSNTDYLTLKYNSSGDLLWKMTYNGPTNHNDKALDICIDNDGYIYVVGQCEDGDAFKYYTVMYAEIEVIDPPDTENVSSSISYTENRGQLTMTNGNVASDVEYYSSKSSPAWFFTDEDIAMVLSTYDQSTDTVDYCRVDMQFHDISSSAKVRAMDKTSCYGNFYYPHLPKGLERVNEYEKLIYSDLFNNIDLIYSTNNAGWKFYYVIKPGGNPADIEFAFSGDDSTYIDASGYLKVATQLGAITLPQGEAYQISPTGAKINLSWSPQFTLDGSSINFSSGTYDSTKPLVFEIKQATALNSNSSSNNLEWCSFIGGGNQDYMLRTKALTNYGSQEINKWVAGISQGFVFPNETIVENNSGNLDAVILFFNYSNNLLWYTFLGGSAHDGKNEMLSGKLGFDVSGYNCFLAFGSKSPDIVPIDPYPGTSHSDANNNCSKVCISEFNVAGQCLWCTYFGQSTQCCEDVASYAVGYSQGKLYVTGYDKDIPLIDGASCQGSFCFLAQFGIQRQLLYSTYHGGSGFDNIYDIDFDNNGSILLTGHTSNNSVLQTSDFPHKNTYGTNAYYEDECAGGKDAFISKYVLDSQGDPDLVWSTYFGGSDDDIGYGIHCENNIYYVTGATNSTDLPTIQGTALYYEDDYQGSDGYGEQQGDAFISKFSQTGEQLFTSYYGGDGDDFGVDIIVDTDGNTYVSMATTTMHNGTDPLEFANPNLSGGYNKSFLSNGTNEQDDFIVGFDSDMDLFWTSYFGGRDDPSFSSDRLNSLSFSENNKLFMVGNTSSNCTSNINTSFTVEDCGGYISPQNSGYEDGFIAVFTMASLIGIDSENEFKRKKLVVYPNPVEQTIFLSFEEPIEWVEVYGIHGRLIQKNKYLDGIPVAGLTTGVYFLKAYTRNQVLVEKFIKK